jgi:hypothetical protein
LQFLLDLDERSPTNRTGRPLPGGVSKAVGFRLRVAADCRTGWMIHFVNHLWIKRYGTPTDPIVCREFTSYDRFLMAAGMRLS